MLEFWLKKGVDGFRLDIIGAIFEDEEFRNSPFIWKILPDEDNKGMLFKSTCRTQNLPESIDFCRELRNLTENFNMPSRFLVGENVRFTSRGQQVLPRQRSSFGLCIQMRFSALYRCGIPKALLSNMRIRSGIRCSRYGHSLIMTGQDEFQHSAAVLQKPG